MGLDAVSFIELPDNSRNIGFGNAQDDSGKVRIVRQDTIISLDNDICSTDFPAAGSENVSLRESLLFERSRDIDTLVSVLKSLP